MNKFHNIETWNNFAECIIGNATQEIILCIDDNDMAELFFMDVSHEKEEIPDGFTVIIKYDVGFYDLNKDALKRFIISVSKQHAEWLKLYPSGRPFLQSKKLFQLVRSLIWQEI